MAVCYNRSDSFVKWLACCLLWPSRYDITKAPKISSIVPWLISDLESRFKIQDDEIGKDDLAAWACIRLDRLRTGYRFVHLLDAMGNVSQGTLLVNVQKSLI